MKKFLMVILILTMPIFAVMKYSAQLQELYQTNYQAMQVPTPSNDALFNYAMTLIYMGKIQEAGKYLKTIDNNDENYKYEMLKKLTNQEQLQSEQDWQFNMKMGLIYYFLFEESHGRIMLYTRRISRGKKSNDQEKVRINRENRKKEWAIKEDYFIKASYYFDKVAKKNPVDNMNAWGYAYQAVLNAVNEDWKISKMFCEKALKIEPDAYAIRAAFMEALRQTGNYLGAISEMNMAYAKKDQQEEYEKKLFGRIVQ